LAGRRVKGAVLIIALFIFELIILHFHGCSSFACSGVGWIYRSHEW
jgi:hypothetical protein